MITVTPARGIWAVIDPDDFQPHFARLCYHRNLIVLSTQDDQGRHGKSPLRLTLFRPTATDPNLIGNVHLKELIILIENIRDTANLDKLLTLLPVNFMEAPQWRGDLHIRFG